MRYTENGEETPSTWGEYRALAFALTRRDDHPAVVLMDAKVSAHGADTLVEASDKEMRALLIPLMRTTP